MAKRARRRRIWSDGEKRMICRQARLPGISVSQVARRYDVNANLVFTWLRDPRFAPEEVTPPIEALAVVADETVNSATTAFLPVELVAEVDAAPSADVPPESHPAGAMEIVLAGGHRLRVEGAYDPDALARLPRGRCRSPGRDPHSGGCAGLAGGGGDGHAARLRDAGRAGRGDDEGGPLCRALVRLPRPSRRSDQDDPPLGTLLCNALPGSGWDGQGACLFSKRLERGGRRGVDPPDRSLIRLTVWPAAKDGKVALTPAQLAMLLEGTDWRAPQRTWRPLQTG